MLRTVAATWRRASAALVVACLGLASLATVEAVAAAPDLTRVVEDLRVGDVNVQGTIDQAMSSPALGDVTGDGVADLVAGGMDGRLSVLDPRTGGVQRRFVVQPDSMIQASPALADLTGDGVLDVLVGTVRNVPGQSHVKAYDLTGGGTRLVFDAHDSGLPVLSGFFGAPAAGDIDGDGALEVVAIGLDHNLHAWELNGDPASGFPLYTYDTSLSSPALADVDGDGADDIVVGGDMDAGQPLAAGGYLWLVRGNGTTFPGYPLRLGGEVIWSSPAVGDVDADGDLDVVVGTGRNFGHSDQRRLYAVDLLSRASLPGWPRALSGNTTGSPALVDLDADPQLEVVTTTGDGRVHRLESDGGVPWSTCANPLWLGCGGDTFFIGSAVVADVDSDAAPEVVVAVNRELLVLSTGTGAIEERLTIRSNPGDYAHLSANAPAVGVIGDTTYIGVAVQVDDGDDARDDGDRQGLYVWSSPVRAASLPWPQFQRDAGRRGSLGSVPAVDLGAYVTTAYRDLLGRSPSDAERSYWVVSLRGGLTRGQFTDALSRSPEWTGFVIDELYQQVFGRDADDGGRRYWSDLVSDGLRVSYVASHFYGSDEWFRAAPPTGGGGDVETFVDNLYRRILGREPDPQKVYWYRQLRSGTSRVTVAAAIYLSQESNRRRVNDLYLQLLGRRSEPEGRDFWARWLVDNDDIGLAAELTASTEYFRRTQ